MQLTPTTQRLLDAAARHAATDIAEAISGISAAEDRELRHTLERQLARLFREAVSTMDLVALPTAGTGAFRVRPREDEHELRPQELA